MSDELSGELAPRPCRAADLAAVIGLLAVIGGELPTGEVSDHLAGRIRHRLEKRMLLESGSTERDLRQSLDDLNHRLRYALGEYDQPPQPVPVPE